LGFDVGAIDGIVGKNTTAQLNNALTDNGYAFDGAVDDEEIKILKVIAKKKHVKLPERMIGVTRKNLEQIMDEKTARLFVASDRNTDRADAFEIVQYKGRTAAKMSVSLSDRGHVDDWGRFGEAGAAQRFQIQENRRFLTCGMGVNIGISFRSIFQKAPAVRNTPRHSLISKTEKMGGRVINLLASWMLLAVT